MTFNALNNEMNYYSSRSKATGKNEWNQDSIQSKFTSMISNCNLTKEQIDKISKFMVKNDVSLDMNPSYNKSVDEFTSMIYSKTSDLEESIQKIA